MRVSNENESVPKNKIFFESFLFRCVKLLLKLLLIRLPLRSWNRFKKVLTVGKVEALLLKTESKPIVSKNVSTFHLYSHFWQSSDIFHHFYLLLITENQMFILKLCWQIICRYKLTGKLATLTKPQVLKWKAKLFYN